MSSCWSNCNLCASCSLSFYHHHLYGLALYASYNYMNYGPPPPFGRRVNQIVARAVDLEIQTDSVDQKPASVVSIKGMSLPLTYDDVAQCLQEKSMTPPTRFIMQRSKIPVSVTSLESRYNPMIRGGGGGSINLDESLATFYNNRVLSSTRALPGALPPYLSLAQLSNGEAIMHGVSIQIHRTLRVPDNVKVDALPPSLGQIELVNVAEHLEKLPQHVLKKGGAFIGMHQREAMLMSFSSSQPCAVKVSVGGVNVITGKPQNEPSDIQDYLVINANEGLQQRSPVWLVSTSYLEKDSKVIQRSKGGIMTSPTDVKQIVPMPLNQGEGHKAGKKNDVVGIQIDVFPRYKTTVRFEGSDLQQYKDEDLFLTPRQLSIKEGTTLFMVNLAEEELSLYAGSPPISHTNSTLIKLNAAHADLVSGSGVDAVSQGQAFELPTGGRIEQKTVRDAFPPAAYNHATASRLHISILNSACFASLDIPMPPCPMSEQTYVEHDIPWLKIYEDDVETKMNSVEGGKPAGMNAQESGICGRCTWNPAMKRFTPCQHVFCDGCIRITALAAGRSRYRCPRCAALVENSASIERESSDGVDARMMQLKLGLERGLLTSYQGDEDNVYGLCGRAVNL